MPGRLLRGWLMTLAGIAAATSALVPLRHRITPDTAALVLVIPVVAGVAVGGVTAAPVGVIFGFAAFDFFFIPPYGTLSVAAGQHWVSLAVYAAVATTVGGVVGQLQRARLEAQARQTETQVLYELSQALATETSLQAKLARILGRVREACAADGATVLVKGAGRLDAAATSGKPIPGPVLQALLAGSPPRTTVPLRSSAGTIGWLVVTGAADDDRADRRLPTFANQAAVAIEQARLTDEADRTRMLEEVDRLRSALMGSVSHDLRTPLASIKAAVSDLADATLPLDERDRATLLATVQEETDRLTRLVSNLLDMSRIEAGALVLHRAATPIDELVTDVVERLTTMGPRHRIDVDVPDDLPLVDIDYLLIDQVITNLIENASAYSPPGMPIAVTARAIVPGWVELRVVDHGPGVPDAERRRIFDQFYRLAADRSREGRTGMGLAICQGVVTAHGGEIWVETTPGGGATFVFRLPIARAGTLADETEATAAGR